MIFNFNFECYCKSQTLVNWERELSCCWWLFYFTGPLLSSRCLELLSTVPIITRLYSVTNNVTNHPGERLIIEKNIQISKLLPLCHLLHCCNYYLDRFLSKISTKCLNDGVFCLAACGHIARPL